MANFVKNNQSNLAYFPSPYTANWRLLGELSLSVGKKWLYTLGIFSLALCEFDLGLQTLGIRFFWVQKIHSSQKWPFKRDRANSDFWAKSCLGTPLNPPQIPSNMCFRGQTVTLSQKLVIQVEKFTTIVQQTKQNPLQVKTSQRPNPLSGQGVAR